MQLTDTIKNCNGCEACVIVCKQNCIKMTTDDQGQRVPVVNEDGCNKCNACKLYCPLFNPVELPEFENKYQFDSQYVNREMAPVYRQTMRSVRAGQHTEFVGTLCQIAALKSLMGDKLRPNLVIYPICCTEENKKNSGCKACQFK